MKRSAVLFTLLLAGLLLQSSCGGSNPTTPNPGPTRTSTSTRTITLTPTETSSRTATPSSTLTATPTQTSTRTLTSTPSDTRTATPTRTATDTRTATSTPTTTSTPLPVGIVFSVSGTTYFANASPVAVATIAVGTSAVWDPSTTASIHNLFISGANLNTCSQNYPTGFGAVTLNLGAGTYQFHCGNHSSCSVGGCGNCNSMAATLIVQ